MKQLEKNQEMCLGHGGEVACGRCLPPSAPNTGSPTMGTVLGCSRAGDKGTATSHPEGSTQPLALPSPPGSVPSSPQSCGCSPGSRHHHPAPGTSPLPPRLPRRCLLPSPFHQALSHFFLLLLPLTTLLSYLFLGGSSLLSPLSFLIALFFFFFLY